MELLTGAPPFPSEGDATAVLIRQVRDPAPALDARWPAAPPALTALLDRCLAKAPEARPSATELRRGLAAVAQAPLPPGIGGASANVNPLPAAGDAATWVLASQLEVPANAVCLELLDGPQVGCARRLEPTEGELLVGWRAAAPLADATQLRGPGTAEATLVSGAPAPAGEVLVLGGAQAREPSGRRVVESGAAVWLEVASDGVHVRQAGPFSRVLLDGQRLPAAKTRLRAGAELTLSPPTGRVRVTLRSALR
jgi:hypothetical protein